LSSSSSSSSLTQIGVQQRIGQAESRNRSIDPLNVYVNRIRNCLATVCNGEFRSSFTVFWNKGMQKWSNSFDINTDCESQNFFISEDGENIFSPKP